MIQLIDLNAQYSSIKLEVYAVAGVLEQGAYVLGPDVSASISYPVQNYHEIDEREQHGGPEG
jgi:hypothetical protein